MSNDDWRGIRPRTAWIGPNLFTVRQSPGARNGSPLALAVDGSTVPFSRLDSDDYVVTSNDRIGEVDRAILRLVKHDGITVRVDGRGPDRALDIHTLRSTVPPGMRVAFLGFVFNRYLRPTLVHSAA
nr:hypothetical protein [uncultured Lichenicoccus sp.]